MSEGVKVIVPDIHMPKWVSPGKARECMNEYLDIVRAKWGEVGASVLTYIGFYTVKQIHEKVKELYPEVKLKDVVDILMNLYEKGYITFEEISE